MTPRTDPLHKSLMATLWQHPNGTFYVRHRDGRFSLKTKDPEKAEKKFNNWKRDRKGIKKRSALAVNLKEFADEFLDYVEVNYPSSTYTLYDQAIKKAKASWGNPRMEDIGPRHIDSLITDMKRSKLSPATINKNLRHIKSALHKAMDWGYAKPFRFPKQVREEKQQRYIPEKDLQKLFKAIKDPEFYDLCSFAVYSGLRSGELVRLSWDDVDNPEGYLRITSEQKNRVEARIPINEYMREVLNRRTGKGKVFRFSTINWVSQKFKGYLVDAGLSQYRFHDLRHSFGSYLAMLGYSPKTIKELMRHKSIQSTMGYLDLSPEHLKEASNGLRIDIEGKDHAKE